MGDRGPVPKRSEERRRRNKDSAVETVVAGGPVVQPEPAEHWHSVAVRWYVSLSESGQAQFFEPSDWESARYVAEAMTQNLEAGRFSAQLFAAVWSAMGELLSTEGSRRRFRVEVERETGDGGEVTDLGDFKRRLASGS